MTASRESWSAGGASPELFDSVTATDAACSPSAAPKEASKATSSSSVSCARSARDETRSRQPPSSRSPMACPSDREGARECGAFGIPKLGVDSAVPAARRFPARHRHTNRRTEFFFGRRDNPPAPNLDRAASASRRTNRRAHDHARPKNSHALKDSSSSSHAEPRPRRRDLDVNNLGVVALHPRRVVFSPASQRRRCVVVASGTSRCAACPAPRTNTTSASRVSSSLTSRVCFVSSFRAVPRPAPRVRRLDKLGVLGARQSATPRLAPPPPTPLPRRPPVAPDSADNIAANASASPPDRRRARHPVAPSRVRDERSKNPLRYQGQTRNPAVAAAASTSSRFARASRALVTEYPRPADGRHAPKHVRVPPPRGATRAPSEYPITAGAGLFSSVLVACAASRRGVRDASIVNPSAGSPTNAVPPCAGRSTATIRLPVSREARDGVPILRGAHESVQQNRRPAAAAVGIESNIRNRYVPRRVDTSWNVSTPTTSRTRTRGTPRP